MSDAELERFNHIPRRVGPNVQARIDALKIGQKMQHLPEELWHDSFKYYVKHDPNRKGGPNLRMIRLDPDKPALTVTGYIFNKFVHPFEDRFVTPREAARLQDFPDQFLFKGSLTSVQQQVGNAVPVRLAHAVAKTVLEHALKYRSLGRYLKTDNDVPALSMFSGAGGMDLGFGEELRKDCGVCFQPVAFIENGEDCCRTLSANFGVEIQPTDIVAVQSTVNFLRRTTGKRKIPVIFGGPPCQAFSQAGRQKADTDNRGQLVFEFIRFVEELRPTYFVMENVSNLKGVSGGELFRRIVTGMKSLGYNVSAFKLCAADYGSPQLRWRWFFVGVDSKYPPVEPPTLTHAESSGSERLFELQAPYRTVGEAFEGLPVLIEQSSQGQAVV